MAVAIPNTLDAVIKALHGAQLGELVKDLKEVMGISAPYKSLLASYVAVSFILCSSYIILIILPCSTY